MNAIFSDLAKGAGAIALAGVALAILALLLGSRKTSAVIHDVSLAETKLIGAAVDPASGLPGAAGTGQQASITPTLVN